MRSGGDFVKVVDFGLAKMRAETPQPSITSPGIVCGTPDYMSPEQGRGDPLDARSDLYAVRRHPLPAPHRAAPVRGRVARRRSCSCTSRSRRRIRERGRARAGDPEAPRRRRPSRRSRRTRRTAYSGRRRVRRRARAALSARPRTTGQRAASSTTRAARCPSCGALNPAAQKFCGECGAATAATPLTSVPAADAGRRSASQPTVVAHVAAPGRRFRPTRRSPSRAAHRARGGPRVARGSPRGGPIAHRGARRRRRGRRQDAPAARVPRLRRRGGGRRRPDGPDPAWAEVGYCALRRAIVHLAALPKTGGGPRDWVAATPEARRGLADVFDPANPERGGGGLSPDERRFAAAEALRWALVRASERAQGHRVVLAIDDLHAVDGASRNAFADVINEPPLVAGACSSPRTRPASIPAGRRTWRPRASSSALPTSGGAQGPRAVGASRARRLFSGRARSCRCYVEQLLRFLREESGAVPARAGRPHRARLERLPAGARRVLQAVAVWGDDADERLLSRMLDGERRPREAARLPPPSRDGSSSRTTASGLRTRSCARWRSPRSRRPCGASSTRRHRRFATSAIFPIEVRALHESAGGLRSRR